MLDGLLPDNDFFRGGLGLALLGGIIAALRNVPSHIGNFVRRAYSVTMTTRDQELIQWVAIWLAETNYGASCRWLDVATSRSGDTTKAVMWPGIGFHSFKHNGKRFMLWHHLEDHGVAGKINVLIIQTFGRSGDPIRNLLAGAIALANERRKGKTVVYMNDPGGWWEEIRMTPQRLRSTLYLREGLAEAILEDATQFFQGKEWYLERGVPYRRGYLLYGPAGNGKSTIIQVLSSEFKLPIYLLSLTSDKIDDSGLAKALGRVPDPCIVVIEDFEKIDLEPLDISMSGLLNAIDGSLASEGRLLVVTANKPEVIDPIFLRPGRIDRRWEIGLPAPEAIEACYNRFSPDGALDKRAFIQEADVLQLTMADIQERLLAATKGRNPLPKQADGSPNVIEIEGVAGRGYPGSGQSDAKEGVNPR